MLINHELIHITLSLIAGFFVFLFFRNRLLFLFALFSGVLIDSDHLIDYFIFKKELAFNFLDFTSGYFFNEMGRVYLFFHAYEYVLILAFSGVYFFLKSKAKKQLAGICFVLALSMVFHLLFDQYSYKPKALTYSIIYRTSKNFDHDSLGFK